MATVNNKTISLSVLSTTAAINAGHVITAGDSAAYILEITFSDVTTITGTCQLYFLKSDGTYATRDASDGVVLADNKVTYTLDSTLYNMARLTCWVQFADSNLYTPLKISFSGIRVPGGTTELVDTQTYPEWVVAVKDTQADITATTGVLLGDGAGGVSAAVAADLPAIDATSLTGLTGVLAGDGTNIRVATAGDGDSLLVTGGTLRGQLSAIDADVENLKLWTDMDMRVFGIEFDTATTSPTLTRINDSVGKVANAGIDAQVVTNDFDALPIFGEMHEVTDSLGNVFIRIPKFYIFKSKGAKTVKKASKYKWDGFYLPWCFWDFANNRELPYFDFGKYKAGNDGSNRLTSKADEYPLCGQNIVTFRSRAQANGAGYQQLDVHAYDVLTTLMQVEFATLDMQSVMQGYTTGRYVATELAQVTESDTNRIIVTNAVAALYRVGQAISVGTSQGGNQVFYGRTITDIVEYDASNMALEFDGAPVTITAGNVLYNTGYKNGFSAGITASSGSVGANDGKYPCSYRGIESPYGDVWQFLDGVNINDWQAWICDNAASYASNVFANPYKQLSYINADAGNWVTEMGLDANNPAAEFPSAVGAIGSSPYKDYYYLASGSRIARVGGAWDAGSYVGPSFWGLNFSTTVTFVSVGGRLLRKAVN